jgi:hypothetical protein
MLSVKQYLLYVCGTWRRISLLHSWCESAQIERGVMIAMSGHFGASKAHTCQSCQATRHPDVKDTRKQTRLTCFVLRLQHSRQHQHQHQQHTRRSDNRDIGQQTFANSATQPPPIETDRPTDCRSAWFSSATKHTQTPCFAPLLARLRHRRLADAMPWLARLVGRSCQSTLDRVVTVSCCAKTAK